MTPFRATVHELLTFVQHGYIIISKYPSLGSRAKKKEKTDSAGNKGSHFVSIYCKREWYYNWNKM